MPRSHITLTGHFGPGPLPLIIRTVDLISAMPTGDHNIHKYPSEFLSEICVFDHKVNAFILMAVRESVERIQDLLDDVQMVAIKLGDEA